MQQPRFQQADQLAHRQPKQRQNNHAREQLHRIEAAFSADGRLLGLRDEIWHDKGAYIRPTGVVVSGAERTTIWPLVSCH